jgi:hypothetical protein
MSRFRAHLSNHVQKVDVWVDCKDAWVLFIVFEVFILKRIVLHLSELIDVEDTLSCDCSTFSSCSKWPHALIIIIEIVVVHQVVLLINSFSFVYHVEGSWPPHAVLELLSSLWHEICTCYRCSTSYRMIAPLRTETSIHVSRTWPESASLFDTDVLL